MAATTRRRGDADYDVLIDGQLAGRVRRETPAWKTLGAKWAAWDAAGQPLGSHYWTRRDAIAAVEKVSGPKS